MILIHFAFYFQINVIPQESVIPGATGSSGGHQSEAVSSSFLSLPAWGLTPSFPTAEPLSLPSGHLPHYQAHYDQVRRHHEMLQHQLQEHIQQFLHQQEEYQGQGSRSEPAEGSPEGIGISLGATEPVVYQREPSIHWRPAMPELRQDESSSRSYLFTSLRYRKIKSFTYL